MLRVALTDQSATLSMRLYETCHTNFCDVEDSLDVVDDFVETCFTNNCKVKI